MVVNNKTSFTFEAEPLSMLISILLIPKIIVPQNLAFRSTSCRSVSTRGHFNGPGQYIPIYLQHFLGGFRYCLITRQRWPRCATDALIGSTSALGMSRFEFAPFPVNASWPLSFNSWQACHQPYTVATTVG